MTDEMGTVAHHLNDVVGVTQEVLALGGGALAIAPPIEHQQAEALVGQRSLGLPLLGASSQRAVGEHYGRVSAPRVDEEVAHGVPLSPPSPPVCTTICAAASSGAW
jgi:hypothetical protein